MLSLLLLLLFISSLLSFYIPSIGLFTWDIEFSPKDSRFYSLHLHRLDYSPHMPRSLVIGRGYLLSLYDKEQIVEDLDTSGFTGVQIEIFKSCSGIKGYEIDEYISKYSDTVITLENELKLFNIQYTRAVNKFIKRIQPYNLDQSKLHPKLWDVLVDLEFTELLDNNWPRLELFVASNDLNNILFFLNDANYWLNYQNLPFIRYEAYKDVLEKEKHSIVMHNHDL